MLVGKVSERILRARVVTNSYSGRTTWFRSMRSELSEENSEARSIQDIYAKQLSGEDSEARLIQD